MSSPNANSSSETKEDKAKDATLYVSDMLAQMESDFQKTGDSIMNRMRKIGNKMDRLEGSISELMHDAGLDDDEGGVANDTTSSPSRKPPSNASPSRKARGGIEL